MHSAIVRAFYLPNNAVSMKYLHKINLNLLREANKIQKEVVELELKWIVDRTGKMAP